MNRHVDTALENERSHLLSVAYRMLGSAGDAEDVVQEALLRAPDSGEVRSLRAYLTRVVTRLCIDELRSARRKREHYVGPWLPEPVLTEALEAPDEDLTRRESVSLAFLILLEELSPFERAVFVLREVFDADFCEIAAAVQRSETACRKLLQRARERVEGRQPRRVASSAEQVAVTSAFFQALTGGDLNELVKLLAANAVTETDHGGKASAARNPVRGAEHVARFFAGLFRKNARQAIPYESQFAFLNGAPGIIVRGPDGGVESAFVLRIETTDVGTRVTSIAAVRNPDKLGALRRGLSIPLRGHG